ncbi:MAG: hypothetical protein GWM92_14315 [Gemmatimonadetes bacterium]|nr:hypothetical protein [Gemmatimonadota bacterium]NIR79914.1 hypothetical protein [Gemmatimonadota bacterium]NIT88633.1 hypothetical protein [Gemmatimonadota bacterium]NIU32448.1 hypothetical protein [Gemmatimonadota bacterium]NIU36943.1 hypothetical protein [Gemmatimonadota bacterium]
MKYLRRIFGLAALVLIAFVAVGILLPGRWSVKRSVTVRVPRDSAFAALRRVDRWRAWMPWPEGVEALGGAETAEGAGFRWDDPRYGSGRFALTETEPPRLLAYEVTLEGGAARIRGRIRLDRGDAGTRVMWSERGEFGRNPILGYTALFMEDRQGTQLEDVLERLRRDLEGSGSVRR